MLKKLVVVEAMWSLVVLAVMTVMTVSVLAEGFSAGLRADARKSAGVVASVAPAGMMAAPRT